MVEANADHDAADRMGDAYLVPAKTSRRPVAPAAQPSAVQPTKWEGKFDFLVSMVAYAVGLGNVWRFPYLCFTHGGGTFLFVYVIFWALAAMPIFLMEVSLGQLLQKGGIEVWKICPIFKGVGIANLVITLVCCSYYGVIATWAIHYVLNSFVLGDFPWERCNHWWNRPGCIGVLDSLNQTWGRNESAGLQSSVEQYWEHRVLQRTERIVYWSSFQWELLAINCVAWLALYFVLWRGITKARLVMYTCALLPYLMFIGLLVRSLFLEGAWEGIRVYLTPVPDKLWHPKLWLDAGTQVFYSYGVGYGALIALGSHNRYHHNCYRDALVMCGLNACTSLMAGCVVFAILGYMAHAARKQVVDVVKSGVGLSFLAYPEVAAILPAKQFWSVLLFTIIVILGLDTQICLIEGAATAVEDIFPQFLRVNKKSFIFALCSMFALVGSIFTTKAGSHWLTIVDMYGCSGIALCFIVFFEAVGIAWGFGWLMGMGLFLMQLKWYEPLAYADGQPYPEQALTIGYWLGGLSVGCIPGYAAFYLLFQPGSLRDIVRRGFTSHAMAPHERTEGLPLPQADWAAAAQETHA